MSTFGTRSVLPGVVAGKGGPPSLGALVADRRGAAVRCGPATLRYWDLDADDQAEPLLVPTGVVRTARGAVQTREIRRALREQPAELASLVPPFAAVAGSPTGVVAVADSMGFRQLFHSAVDAGGPAVLSTSALLAGCARSAELDETGLAVQSLLGWQLGQRTLFRGIDKLIPGAVATIGSSGIEISEPEPGDDSPLPLEEAVRRAAELLRSSLSSLLDEHPDAVLQLTGGQDSRILLSAIPPARRRGLRAMTLGLAGSSDATIAASIAARYGVRHEIHGIADLAELTPAEAWQQCCSAALRLDAMSDPVAHAALTIAEQGFEQGVRISGLGGEVGRGFYYVGRVSDRSYDRKDAVRLAAWRMFANEAVEDGLLTLQFGEWGREAAYDAVYAALREASDEWFQATDGLYLRHRMQRWAGATDTAVAYQRVVINPMLDATFIDVASRLTPVDKARSRFLAMLQMELDPELGRMPLDGRPAPLAYAAPTPWHRVTSGLTTGRKLVRKVGQRVRRGRRPPAGGAVLAAKVVEHWRAHPDLLAPVSVSGIVEQAWLASVLESGHDPTPSSVAFLTNLCVAEAARVGSLPVS